MAHEQRRPLKAIQAWSVREGFERLRRRRAGGIGQRSRPPLSERCLHREFGGRSAQCRRGEGSPKGRLREATSFRADCAL